MYAPHKIIYDRLDFKPEGIIPSLDYVVTYDWDALLGDLHRLLFDAFHQEGKPGWNWLLPEFTRSALSFSLLREIYFAAGEGETFKAIYRTARHEAEYLVTGFDPTHHSVVNLYDLLERWHVFTAYFNEWEHVQRLMKPLHQEVFLQHFAQTLTRDTDYAAVTGEELRIYATHIALQRRWSIQARAEIVQRVQQYPEIVKRMMSLWESTTDWTRYQQHNRAVEGYLRQTVRGRDLYEEEAVDKLRDLIEQTFSPLMDKDLRTKLAWADAHRRELIYFPNRLKDRVKNLQRDAARFQSLESRVSTSRGDTAAVLELLEAVDSASYTPRGEIDEDFPPEQLNALDSVLGKIGREIFVYRYKHPEIIGRGEGKIIAQALGYAPATVSKYLKVIAEKAPTIKKIMYLY